ncbi:hypothetical protein F2Q69_00007628 [Brassica cretica]|uniref:Disease resistance N-terminal domain-containing protein n=1 Tax=Brassica cretica TaxID=69181 RepID=A0A8S9P554_BRACR|nr:hypothetical protein F2Q69_00007628 [Brassica cretica]
MVAAITGFVVAKMGNYLIDEISMLIGVKDDLEELKTELTCIQGYLKDVEAREKEDEITKTRPDEINQNIRRDSYRITDDIGSLKRRISDVTRKRETYGIGNFNEPRQGGGNISSLKVSELRRARPVDQEELVVGLDDDAKILLAKLLDDDDVVEKRYIISNSRY